MKTIYFTLLLLCTHGICVAQDLNIKQLFTDGKYAEAKLLLQQKINSLPPNHKKINTLTGFLSIINQKIEEKKRDSITTPVTYVHKSTLPTYLSNKIKYGHVLQSSQMPTNISLKIGNYIFENGFRDRCFFTACNKKDSIKQLYMIYKINNKWSQPRKIKILDAEKMDIDYPLFSPDGMTLIFSAKDFDSPQHVFYITRFDNDQNIFLKPQILDYPYSPSQKYLFYLPSTESHANIISTDLMQTRDSVEINQIKVQQLPFKVSLSKEYLFHIPIFILNHQKMIYSIDEFKNDKSKKIYENWRILIGEISTLEKNLKKMRQSTIIDKKTILSKEKELKNKTYQLKNLAKELRTLENL